MAKKHAPSAKEGSDKRPPYQFFLSREWSWNGTEWLVDGDAQWLPGLVESVTHDIQAVNGRPDHVARIVKNLEENLHYRREEFVRWWADQLVLAAGYHIGYHVFMANRTKTDPVAAKMADVAQESFLRKYR